MADDKNQETLRVYVGDMMSFESHIEEALDHQLDLTKANPKAHMAVQKFHDMAKAHRDGLKAHMEKVGGSGGSPIKAAVAAVAGKAAGLIDKVRPASISKAIRDDYTAMNHATIGYTMLHATALMLRDQTTASLAERYIRDYASAIEGINQIIADVVAYDLREDGLMIDESAIAQTTEKINKIWQQTDPAVR